ncbi:glycan biosynthesis hexose transferase WsfD [Lapidilactobacillus wuchangensis]|uniref:glycan biosynthesis hexose transferase WsfD n=1 Tax=Lapidilactobacillus wuchangensis TaxID=2486001 RepID=UPI00177BE56E|nr:hypothetical protein [Lapidilactobacillus wuchangensis]
MAKIMVQMRQIWRRLTRYISPALLATIAIAIIAGILLFVPPYNGYANNGDFERSMYISGLYVLPDRPYNHFNYFVRQFGIMQYFNESAATLFSSQPMIIKTAIMLNKFFYSTTIFDIRFLGVLYYVFYLGAIYLLTEALTFRMNRRRAYLLAAIMVFIFGDSSLTLYFNSFFAEPAMLISFIYLFACTLLITRRRYRHVWPLYLLFAVSTVIFITVKQQNAPLAVIVAFIFMSFIFAFQSRGAKLLVTLGTLAIIGTGVITYAKITKDFNDINQYQSMTRGVLLNAKDPGKSLQAGGINRQYALLRGLPYFETYMPQDLHGQEIKQNLLAKYNFVWILRYYLGHLDQFGELLDLAARDTQIVQVSAVGDYEQSAGKAPIAQTHYFTGYSLIKKAFYPKVFSFYLLLLVVLTGVYSYAAYQDFKHQRSENIVRLALVIGCSAMIIAVCLISIIGDGDADLAKHLFMAPLAVDLLTVLLISDILSHRLFQFVPMAETVSTSDSTEQAVMTEVQAPLSAPSQEPKAIIKSSISTKTESTLPPKLVPIKSEKTSTRTVSLHLPVGPESNTSLGESQHFPASHKQRPLLYAHQHLKKESVRGGHHD